MEAASRAGAGVAVSVWGLCTERTVSADCWASYRQLENDKVDYHEALCSLGLQVSSGRIFISAKFTVMTSNPPQIHITGGILPKLQ